MKFPKKILWIISMLNLGLASTITNAQEWSLVPRLGVGVMDYSLDVPTRSITINGTPVTVNEFKFDAELKFISIGATVLKDRFYVDVYGQISDNDNSAGTNEIVRDSNFVDFVEEQELNRREDYSITFGYRVVDFANIYAGYRIGKTSFGRGTLGTNFDFDEEGFFIGGSLLWPISDVGVIAVNLAVAELDSDIDIDVTFEGSPLPPESFSDKASSSTTGISYGISWNSRLTDKLSYAISFDGHNYKFKDPNGDNSEFTGDVDEEIFTLRASLSYEFD